MGKPRTWALQGQIAEQVKGARLCWHANSRGLAESCVMEGKGRGLPGKGDDEWEDPPEYTGQVNQGPRVQQTSQSG